MKKRADPPFADVRRLLLGYEFDGPSLGLIIGASKSTGNRRLQNPGDLTLSELRMICRNGNIPADRIRDAIKFDY